MWLENLTLSYDLTNLIVISVLALPFLYEFSNTFRFSLKFLIYHVLVMLCAVAVIPVIAWRPGNVLNTVIATRPLLLVSLLFGLQYEVRGMQHITNDRAAIIVANHQSSLDFLGMVHVWPMFRKITAIAKKELFYAMPFGLTAWLCGTRFIDRSNPQKAKESMNQAMEFCKEFKVKLWIFAEGTRSMKEEMLPFKKGAFYLAISGQVPILPVVYSTYTGFLNHKQRIFNPGNIIITCLPAIETTGLTLEDMPQLMEDVRKQMMEKYTEVSGQVKQPFPISKQQSNSS